MLAFKYTAWVPGLDRATTTLMPTPVQSSRAQSHSGPSPGLWCLALACVPGISTIAGAEGPAPTVEVRPSPVHVERSGNSLVINPDFLITNSTGEAWLLQEIEVSIYDATDQLQLRKSLNDNGNSPGIATVNRREIGAGQTILVFNPFHTFADDLQLSAVVFRFLWRGEESGRVSSSNVRIAPLEYSPKAEMLLPLRIRSIVWDGHDYYSHHRRFNYLSPYSLVVGTHTNPDRYGHDLVPVSDAGEMHSGTPASNGSWFGFGKPIFAAASGRVVASFDGGLDNREVDEERLKTDKLADYGNYLVIDHGGGEFALYGHIKQGSARVGRGDVVERGQQIADIGASGSSLMPHLHFQLQSGPDTDAEGLPSCFTDFVRVLGVRRIPVSRGPIDSGDIVESGDGRH